MEAWQEHHIETTLHQLVRLTNCTIGLLAKLRAHQLLTEEQTGKMQKLGDRDASLQLYNILKTKKHAYILLMDALEEERQTGAFNVLAQGLDKQFVNTKVSWMGQSLPIKQIFPEISPGDVNELLKDPQFKAGYYNFCRPEDNLIRIDTNIPPHEPMYLPREVSMGVYLDEKVFKQSGIKDIFVFTGISQYELSGVLRPIAIQSANAIAREIRRRHICLEPYDKNVWTYLIGIANDPIHLIKVDKGQYVIQDTSGLTQIVLDNRSRHKPEQTSYVQESQFVTKLLSDVQIRTTCICDTAGMGKTWFLQSIGRQLCNQLELAFFVSMPDFSRYLHKIGNTMEGKRLDRVLEFTCRSNWIISLLLHVSKTYKRNLYLLLDGFDEMEPDKVDHMISFLRDILNEHRNVFVCVSSRPHLKTKLETTLLVNSQDLLPFDHQNQVDRLTKHWNPQSAFAHSELEKFAEHCIKTCSRLEDNGCLEILGVPQKCFMLATIHETYAELISSGRERPQMRDTVIINSVSELYEKYIEHLLQKLTQIYNETNRVFSITELLNFHTCAALRLICPDIPNDYIKQKFTNYVPDTVLSFGILIETDQVKNMRHQFIHRTFAEYFVAKFFTELLLNNNPDMVSAFEISNSQYFLEYLIKTLFGTNKSSKAFCHHGVLGFMDPLLKNVISENLEFIPSLDLDLQINLSAKIKIFAAADWVNMLQIVMKLLPKSTEEQTLRYVLGFDVPDLDVEDYHYKAFRVLYDIIEVCSLEFLDEFVSLFDKNSKNLIMDCVRPATRGSDLLFRAFDVGKEDIFIFLLDRVSCDSRLLFDYIMNSECLGDDTQKVITQKKMLQALIGRDESILDNMVEYPELKNYKYTWLEFVNAQYNIDWSKLSVKDRYQLVWKHYKVFSSPSKILIFCSSRLQRLFAVICVLLYNVLCMGFLLPICLFLFIVLLLLFMIYLCIRLVLDRILRLCECGLPTCGEEAIVPVCSILLASLYLKYTRTKRN